MEFAPVVVTLREGRRATVRAVRPDDKDRLQAAVRGLSDASRYTRFMSPLRQLTPKLLERAVNPEAGRELQLVAVVDANAEERIVGGARYTSEPGSTDCEFAIALTDDWQGVGLARRLLELLMEAARADGFARMDGYVLASNARMLGLARRLGFVPVASPEGPTVCKVRRELGSPAPPRSA